MEYGLVFCSGELNILWKIIFGILFSFDIDRVFDYDILSVCMFVIVFCELS